MNIYVPNNTATTFVKQKLQEIQGNIDGNTLIIGGFNTPHSIQNKMDQKKKEREREIENLNNINNRVDLIHIY